MNSGFTSSHCTFTFVLLCAWSCAYTLSFCIYFPSSMLPVISVCFLKSLFIYFYMNLKIPHVALFLWIFYVFFNILIPPPQLMQG